MIRFTIPYPPEKAAKTKFLRTYSLNAYYSGKHWGQRKQEMDAWHMAVLCAMKNARLRKEPVKGPVEITFRWDDGLDIDNHAVLGKAVVDALKGYVIQDDNPRRFRRVSHEFWRGGCVAVEIEEARENGRE